MAGLARVTNPLLDVLEVLLEAFDEGGSELHGWAIMKNTKRSGPTVYGVLDRLEDAGWVTAHWEEQHPEQNKPRRRFYTLTPTGAVSARRLLAERRSAGSLRQPKPGLAYRVRLHTLLAGGSR